MPRLICHNWPGCPTACEQTAFLTASRDLPQISYSCNSPALSDKDRFPTFVRTTSSYYWWGPAIGHNLICQN